MSFSFQNIVDSDGLGIAFTGMSIVFVALAAVTLFIAILPKVLAALEGVLPHASEHHHVTPPAHSTAAVDEAVAVAIGYALHERMAGQRGAK